MDLTDEQIAKNIQDGDVNSFDFLVDRYQAKMSRYAKKFFLNREDTQDLVQNVFLKVYENIQSFDAKQKFSPWIYRIAHNEFVNHLKRRDKQPVTFFDLDTIFPQPVSQEDAMYISNKRELKEMREDINKCLAKLNIKYREPLVLFYFQDLSYKDISDILKIPTSTVGVRIKRGREELKNILNNR